MKRILKNLLLYFIYFLIGVFVLLYFPIYIVAIAFKIMYKLLIYPIERKGKVIMFYGKMQRYFNLMR